MSGRSDSTRSWRLAVARSVGILVLAIGWAGRAAAADWPADAASRDVAATSKGLTAVPQADKRRAGEGTREQPARPNTKADVAGLTVAYLQAVEQQQFERVRVLLDPNVEFITPGREIHGAADLIAALRKISPVLVRNDVKKVFADGDQVCVIYDFVTNTPVGALPSVEWITFREGKIASVRLIFHSEPWAAVLQELKKRTQPGT